MLSELICQYTGTLDDFIPCPPAYDRGAWEKLNIFYRQGLVRHGETYMGYQYPFVPAVLYMEYYKTNDHSSYQALIKARRLALNSLVLAECAENKGRFLSDIINGIFVICEESTWQLPSHNTAPNDTSCKILADITKPALDFTACETGALLSMVYYLLKDALENICPVITKRIQLELDTRIITPYLQENFYWMKSERNTFNTCTAWCTQNILLTAFLTGQPQDIKHKTVEKSILSLDYFLSEYSDEGCLDEGAEHYRHTGLCLFHAINILNNATNGYLNSIYEHDKIKNISSYIINLYVSGLYYVNFGDCSPLGGEIGVREFLFGKLTDNTRLMNIAATIYQHSANKVDYQEANLYYRILSAFCHKEISNHTISLPTLQADCYYKSTGLFVARDDVYTLAVKAGNNSAEHNDTGSFIIYKNGKPMFIDIGTKNSIENTTCLQEVNILTRQSDYHNLPTINNALQSNGSKYQAEDIIINLSETESFIQMNLAPAYERNAGIQQYIRTAVLRKGRSIIINDKFFSDSTANIILNLITCDTPVIFENTIQIGSLGTLVLVGDFFAETEILPITDTELKTIWQHDLYRIKIHITSSEFTLQIK